MMRRRRCAFCNDLFTPDPRVGKRQRRSVSVRFVRESTVNVDVVPVLRGPRGAVQVPGRWNGD